MGEIKRWCSAWDGTDWCPQPPTTYVYIEQGEVGGSEDGTTVITGATYQTLCDGHAAEAKTHRGWVWSRPLGLHGSA